MNIYEYIAVVWLQNGLTPKQFDVKEFEKTLSRVSNSRTIIDVKPESTEIEVVK